MEFDVAKSLSYDQNFIPQRLYEAKLPAASFILVHNHELLERL